MTHMFVFPSTQDPQGQRAIARAARDPLAGSGHVADRPRPRHSGRRASEDGRQAASRPRATAGRQPRPAHGSSGPEPSDQRGRRVVPQRSLASDAVSPDQRPARLCRLPSAARSVSTSNITSDLIADARLLPACLQPISSPLYRTSLRSRRPDPHPVRWISTSCGPRR